MVTRARKHYDTKYSVTPKTIQPWINQHQSIQLYLQRLNSNKERIACYLYYYCEWANKTPEELLELKNTFENSEAEKLLDNFIIAQTNFPDCTKFNIVNAVKAFYRNNYHQLQPAAGKFEYSTVKSQKVASKEVCEKLFKACYNPRDQALIMLSTCTAIAIETMAKLRWSYFEENWQNQELPCLTIPGDILKGHNKGKYRGVQQVTFLTPEAKTILLEYRKYYEKTFKHHWKETDNIFLSIKDNIHEPLAKEAMAHCMSYLSKRAGVKFGIHDGRARVQTALENVGVSVNWIRKAKGRKVKGEESPYSKPAVEQLRKKYREALPDLEFHTTTHQAPLNPQQDFLNKFADILQKRPDISSKFEEFLLNL